MRRPEAVREASKPVFSVPARMQVNGSLVPPVNRGKCSLFSLLKSQRWGGWHANVCVFGGEGRNPTYSSLLIGITVLANFPKPVVMP